MKFWLKTPLMAAASGGDGGGGGPAFDAAAFKTEMATAMAAEVNKAVNGAMKTWNTRFDDLSKLVKGAGGAGGDSSGGDGSGGDGSGGDGKPPKGGDVNTNTQVQLLTRQVKDLQEKGKEAERREKEATAAKLEGERKTSIWNAINSLEMRDGEAGKLLFAAVSGSITRDDEGNLIAQSAAGPISADLHIKQFAEAHPYLLKPAGGGGAGATGGTTRTGSGPHYDIDKMSVSEIGALKPEVRQELWNHVRGQIAATRS